MKIHGFNTLTLLDYPGHLAADIFLGGCNFRCPFCQNAGLVLHPEQEPCIGEDTVFSYLKKRRGILEGVCITGGEPTLCVGLPKLIGRIKELGYLVKLDTNGSRPDVIRSLHSAGLIDYVAMDIKSSLANYGRLTGISKPDTAPIKESAAYLMESGIDYEFRTTVVKELHEEKDFEEIGKWLAGCRHYYLQAYKDSENLIQKGLHGSSAEEMQHFQKLLLKTIPVVELRGIDI